MISRLESIIAAAILLCVITPTSARPQTVLDKRATFVMENFDEEIILRRFSEKFKVPIGFEVITGEASRERYRRISIRVENGTVRNVFDAFVNADPRYKWEMSNGVVNISPKTAAESVLEVQVSGFCFSEVNLDKLGFLLLELPEVKARLKSLGVKPSTTTLKFGARKEPSRFSISLPDMTVREILNELVRQRHTSYWLVERHGANNEYISIGLLSP